MMGSCWQQYLCNRAAPSSSRVHVSFYGLVTLKRPKYISYNDPRYIFSVGGQSRSRGKQNMVLGGLLQITEGPIENALDSSVLGYLRVRRAAVPKADV